MRSYYELLEVSRDASPAEIQKAYKKKALQHHPDKNPGSAEEATEVFKAIGEAYLVLRDPQKRAAYDHSLENTSWSASTWAPEDEGFTFSMAKDLFRETFGEDVTKRLERVASETAAVAQHVAERCAQAEPVVTAVSAQLSSMAQEAQAEEKRLQRDVSARQRELAAIEKEQKEQEVVRKVERKRLEELEAEGSKTAVASTLLVLAVLVGVALRGWLRHAHTLYWAVAWVPYWLVDALPMALVSLLVSFTRCSRIWLLSLVSGCILEVTQVFHVSWFLLVLLGVAFLRSAYQWWRLLQMWQRHQSWRVQDEADAAYLEAEWRKVSHSCRGAQRMLEEAKLKAEKAREEVESVQRDGASLAYAARAGIHFIGKLMRRSNGQALE